MSNPTRAHHRRDARARAKATDREQRAATKMRAVVVGWCEDFDALSVSKAQTLAHLTTMVGENRARLGGWTVLAPADAAPIVERFIAQECETMTDRSPALLVHYRDVLTAIHDRGGLTVIASAPAVPA